MRKLKALLALMFAISASAACSGAAHRAESVSQMHTENERAAATYFSGDKILLDVSGTGSGRIGTIAPSTSLGFALSCSKADAGLVTIEPKGNPDYIYHVTLGCSSNAPHNDRAGTSGMPLRAHIISISMPKNAIWHLTVFLTENL